MIFFPLWLQVMMLQHCIVTSQIGNTLKISELFKTFPLLTAAFCVVAPCSLTVQPEHHVAEAREQHRVKSEKIRNKNKHGGKSCNQRESSLVATIAQRKINLTLLTIEVYKE